MIALQARRLIPRLIVEELARAVAFYKQALGAEETERWTDEHGRRLLEVQLRVGQAVFQVREASACADPGCMSTGHQPKAVTLHLEVDDCDAAVARAASAGAEVTFPPADMSWGDRYARIRDPFGHEWSFADSRGDRCRSAA